MLQLRNRYNLEKRRLENLRLEKKNKSVRSPWPLFQHLKFLDGHIRPRRSYKSMMSRRTFEETLNALDGSTVRNGGSGDGDEYDGEDKQPEIKYETELDSEEDQQNSNNEEIGDNNITQDDGSGYENAVMATYSNNSTAAFSGPLRGSTNGLISVRNIDSMRCDYHYSDDFHVSSLKKRKICCPEKFEAFGKFLTLSLCDLPEDKALLLIEKFTSDIVKATLESRFRKDNIRNNSSQRDRGNEIVPQESN